MTIYINSVERASQAKTTALAKIITMVPANKSLVVVKPGKVVSMYHGLNKQVG